MMKCAWRLGAVAAVLLWISVPAVAQEAPPVYGSFIVSEGVATVESAPDYVEFWLQRSVESATAAEAVYAAAQLEGDLDSQLKTSALPAPSSHEVSEVSFTDVNHPAAKASAHVIFSARPYADPKTGLIDFAALCDGIVAFAQSLNCTVEGPFFTAAAKEELEQSAVSRAVEQALTPALGAAMVMKARIDTVDSVEVQNVTWNQEPEARVVQPQVRRITCTARVQVRYLFSAGP